MSTTSVLALPAYSRRARTDAFRKIEKFAMRDEFEDQRGRAGLLFWAGRLGLATDAQRLSLESDNNAWAAFLNWFIFDLDLSILNDDTHGTLAERFLATQSARLTAGERTLLERMHGSSLRLYEVREVRLDEGMSLHDLWTDERIEVHERLATHQIARWDLLGARVIDSEHGYPVIEGAPYLYPTDARDAILAEFRYRHRELDTELPADDATAFFKHVGMVFNHLWLDYVALRPMPTVVTHEGHLLTPTKSLFDIHDTARVTAALAAHPAFEPADRGSFIWHDVDDDPSRILGHVSIARGRLTLETMSEARAERGRRLLESLLGDAVRFRMTRTEELDTDAVLDDDPAAGRRGESEFPPEVQLEIVGQFYEQHYRAWIDEPIPALGNRTPRHAARLKTVRPKLVRLIKKLENGMERGRTHGQPYYDVGWMWAELGLDRP